MSKSIGSSTRAFFSVAAAVCVVFALVGCDGSNPGSGGSGGGLVLPDGWAWVYEAVPGMAGTGTAYVFRSNGDFMSGSNVLGEWTFAKAGTWSGATGSAVKITMTGAAEVEVPYTISGETLSYMGITYTKTNIGSAAGGGGDKPITSNNLINAANEAWVSGPAGERGVLVITATQITFYDEEDGEWDSEGPYSYTLSGTKITVTIPGEEAMQVTAVLSNNNNTLTVTDSDGDVTVYTRMTNPVGSGGGGGNLINCSIAGVCTPGVFTAAQCAAAGGTVVASCGTGGGDVVNCMVAGVCMPGLFTSAQCAEAGGTVVASCGTGGGDVVNCMVAGVCMPGLLTSAQCAEAGGTVVASCGTGGGDVVNCMVAGACIPGLTIVECVALSGTVVASCSTGGGGGIDNNLVNAANQAWVNEAAGLSTAYRFKANGTYELGTNMGGSWVFVPGGIWSVNGGVLRLSIAEVPVEHPYAVSGNTLTFMSLTFTKTTIPSGGSGGNPGIGGNVVTDAGEAWIMDEGSGFGFGVMFNANGSALIIVGIMGMWFEYESSTWSANGNQLTMTFDGETESMTYSVVGNILIFTYTDEGETFTDIYTKVSGITLLDFDFDFEGSFKTTNNVRLPKVLQKR